MYKSVKKSKIVLAYLFRHLVIAKTNMWDRMISLLLTFTCSRTQASELSLASSSFVAVVSQVFRSYVIGSINSNQDLSHLCPHLLKPTSGCRSPLMQVSQASFYPPWHFFHPWRDIHLRASLTEVCCGGELHGWAIGIFFVRSLWPNRNADEILRSSSLLTRLRGLMPMIFLRTVKCVEGLYFE